MAKAAKKLEVLVLNPIAQVGLKRLPAERYEVVKESKSPDVILVRSADMHAMKFDASAEGGRPRRRRRQQHSGGGALEARRAGVQRAGRERQRGEGTGASPAC